jgi:RNA polymerase sigma-70 factor (sigma-E family)
VQDLAALVESDGAALLRFAFLLCRDAGRAEDLVQDALVRMMRSHSTVEAPAAYARKVIVNEYLGWRRRRWSTEIVRTDDADVGVDDSVDAVADRDLVWRLIGSLPPRARAVLVLRYYEDLPDAEIAAVVGCAEATVRSIAARAFARLRTHPQLSSLEPKEA